MRISGSDAIIVMDNEVWYCIDGLPNRNFDTYNSLTPNWYYKVLR